MPTAYEAEATVPTTVLEMAHRCGEFVALADVGMMLHLSLRACSDWAFEVAVRAVRARR